MRLRAGMLLLSMMFMLTCPALAYSPAQAYPQDDNGGHCPDPSFTFTLYDVDAPWSTSDRQAVNQIVIDLQNPLRHDGTSIASITQVPAGQVAVYFDDAITGGARGSSANGCNTVRLNPILHGDSTGLRHWLEHEFMHMLGHYHSEGDASTNSQNPPVIATCTADNLPYSGLSADDWAYMAWQHLGSAGSRVVTPNHHFQDGNVFWTMSDTSGTFATGSDSGDRFGKWQSPGGSLTAYLKNGVNLVAGDDADVPQNYRAAALFRSPGSGLTSTAKVEVWYRRIEFPLGGNCADTNFPGNFLTWHLSGSNKRNPNGTIYYLSDWAKLSGMSFQDFNGQAWTTVVTPWTAPTAAVGFLLQVRVYGKAYISASPTSRVPLPVDNARVVGE